MRTYTASGRHETITMKFLEDSKTVTEFSFQFAAWDFYLVHCMGGQLHNVPQSTIKTWRIDFTREHFRVECNGKLVKNIVFADQGESCKAAMKGHKVNKVMFLEGIIDAFAKVQKI